MVDASGVERERDFSKFTIRYRKYTESLSMDSFQLHPQKDFILTKISDL